MSADEHVADVTALSDTDLDSLLERLESEERTLSKRRGLLHSRIDFIHGGGAASAEPETDQLALLGTAERELSDQRRALHRMIDELRAERSRRSV